VHLHELGQGLGDRALLRRFQALLRAVQQDRGRLAPLPPLEDRLLRPVPERTGHDAFHVIVALDAGRLVGGTVSTYLAGANAAHLHALAVDGRRRVPDVRRLLLARTEAVLRADARRAGRDPDRIRTDDGEPVRAAVPRPRSAPVPAPDAGAGRPHPPRMSRNRRDRATLPPSTTREERT
jgi:hypothetical protein